MSESKPVVGIIMGSDSDWPTMIHAHKILDSFKVPNEYLVLSAHRTPDLAAEYAKTAEARGLKVIIAGAGGAAHLAGVLAAYTVIPVLGVPIMSRSLNGVDSLYSMVQMPAGIPVGTLAIGEAGAKNAALFAVSILGVADPNMREKLHTLRKEQHDKIAKITLEG